MIRVLIVDDDKLFRTGLRTLLSREKDILIVAEAHDGQEAIDLTCDLEPNVVLMDYKMRYLDGLRATQQICGRENTARVVTQAGSYDDSLVRTALANGAHGYVAKHDDLLELPQAIRTIYAGKTYFSPSVPQFLPPVS